MPDKIEHILAILAFRKFANEGKQRVTVIYETLID